ncbi:MAG: STAS-like domain-containing protein [Rickettsiales bacterium]
MKDSDRIKDYLLRNVGKNPSGITAQAMQEFSLSRPAILHYINQAITEGLLIGEGATRARRYRLKNTLEIREEVELFPDIEGAVWKYKIFPKLKLPANILGICEHGFTEMLNNAIDHSESKEAVVYVRQNYACIEIFIIDKGVGIFEKIQKARNLENPQAALLELSKGKLTTYPARHAGEGIFFSSRMFDRFIIRSGTLFYERSREDDDEWLVEMEERRYRRGTLIYMEIATNASWTKQDVFAKYQNDQLRFRRTHVPIALAREPGQQLVSRSQAKRILSRFDQFAEVLLDFKGVEDIGQGFADEIFRIFPEAHPDIPLHTINTSPTVEKMIAFVKANAPKLPPGLIPDN